MLLTADKSICEEKQSIVISRDKGSPREHRATNPQRQYSLRQYRLDGDLVQQEKCCDFLLLNDSLKKAYLIELKGSNLDDAIPQLEAGEQKVKGELKDYLFYYRLVVSKAKTHDIHKTVFRKFQEKHGSYFVFKTGLIEETLG